MEQVRVAFQLKQYTTSSWKTPPQTNLAAGGTVTMEVTSNLNSINAWATYRTFSAGVDKSFMIQGQVPNVISGNTFSSTATPSTSLIITHDDPAHGSSPHVTFVVADSLQNEAVVSFRALGNYSHRFLDKNSSNSFVRLTSSPYDLTAHPSEKWQLESTGSPQAWYIKNLGETNTYLRGNTSNGEVYLDTFSADQADLQWALSPLSGNTGQYMLYCMGTSGNLHFLSGDTQTGDVQLAEQ
ncbi:MAG: hypothetical protein AAF560_30185 [Acidobacteriota bacterium]